MGNKHSFIYSYTHHLYFHTKPRPTPPFFFHARSRDSKEHHHHHHHHHQVLSCMKYRAHTRSSSSSNRGTVLLYNNPSGNVKYIKTHLKELAFSHKDRSASQPTVCSKQVVCYITTDETLRRRRL